MDTFLRALASGKHSKQEGFTLPDSVPFIQYTRASYRRMRTITTWPTVSSRSVVFSVAMKILPVPREESWSPDDPHV